MRPEFNMNCFIRKKRYESLGELDGTLASARSAFAVGKGLENMTLIEQCNALGFI